MISEVWFGSATEEDLRPNIDGLSFDEVLLAMLPGVILLLVIRRVARRRRIRREVEGDRGRLAHA